MSDLPVIRIAYAEDHIDFRKELIRQISEFDKNIQFVIEADNGKELLEKIDKSVLQPDLCILDLRMPGMDGYNTAVALRKEYPHIRIMVLSFFETELAIIQLFRLGAGGYFTKGENPKEIARGIREIYTDGYCFTSGPVKQKFPKISIKNLAEYCKKALTEEELAYMRWCCTNLNHQQIGDEMHLSKRTAEGYPARLCEKLNIPATDHHNRMNLSLVALNSGLAPMDIGDTHIFEV